VGLAIGVSVITVVVVVVFLLTGLKAAAEEDEEEEELSEDMTTLPPPKEIVVTYEDHAEMEGEFLNPVPTTINQETYFEGFTIRPEETHHRKKIR
jgi:hypothetical protein